MTPHGTCHAHHAPRQACVSCLPLNPAARHFCLSVCLCLLPYRVFIHGAAATHPSTRCGGIPVARCTPWPAGGLRCHHCSSGSGCGACRWWQRNTALGSCPKERHAHGSVILAAAGTSSTAAGAGQAVASRRTTIWQGRHAKRTATTCDPAGRCDALDAARRACTAWARRRRRQPASSIVTSPAAAAASSPCGSAATTGATYTGAALLHQDIPCTAAQCWRGWPTSAAAARYRLHRRRPRPAATCCVWRRR